MRGDQAPGLRFGDKVAAPDPSDIEAMKAFQAQGGTFVGLSKGECANVRRAGAVLPAGKICPTAKPYSLDPNADPVDVVPEDKWTDEAVFPLIAQRSRGSPRLALRLVQACRRGCRAGGASTIILAHLERAWQLEGIDALGLGPTEQAYLTILADGASRLNGIASMLGLPPRTVSQVTEPFLLRAGLIAKDDTGRRQLTASGRDNLSRSRTKGVQ